MQHDAKTVLLPRPRGFCAGVIRAIDIVEIALERLGAPVVSVAGADENIKLTTPDDLARAESIIQARSRA